MPGHKTYDLVGAIAVGGAGIGIAVATGSVTDELICFVAAGFFGTYFFSPDLDLRTSRISRRWGPLQILWWPYQYLVPHRSWISHSGISAALRLAYVGLVVWIVATIFGFHLTYNGDQLGPILAGLILADLVHVILDRLF